MKVPADIRSARELPWLFTLCIVIWAGGAIMGAYAIWQFSSGAFWEGIQSISYSAITIAAGIWLYRLKSTGATLFGLVLMRLEVELISYIRHSIPAFDKQGSLALFGGILYFVSAILFLVPTGILTYQLINFFQTEEAWRPGKGIHRWPWKQE